VLQCVAVCCSVLQCVAVCCSVLFIERHDLCICVLQCVTVRCSVLQCVAVCCSVLFIERHDLCICVYIDLQRQSWRARWQCLKECWLTWLIYRGTWLMYRGTWLVCRRTSIICINWLCSPISHIDWDVRDDNKLFVFSPGTFDIKKTAVPVDVEISNRATLVQ